ncbi:TPA: hypothetical protein LA827_003344 [Clostridium botulinum]|nr:hypothetical protein [Clostridium botulinum]
MKTLIIYDEAGNIIFTKGGCIDPLIGETKCLETDIPEGKFLKGVDVKTGQPVLEDIPKSEVEILKEKVASLTEANAELTSIVANIGTKNV